MQITTCNNNFIINEKKNSMVAFGKVKCMFSYDIFLVRAGGNYILIVLKPRGVVYSVFQSSSTTAAARRCTSGRAWARSPPPGGSRYPTTTDSKLAIDFLHSLE